MIGLVGAKGSGKTVLMTVLVKQLREVVGLRFGADIRIATDNPDGHQGLSDYQASREVPLYSNRTLPTMTQALGSGSRLRSTPIVLRWRQETARLMRGQSLQLHGLVLRRYRGRGLERPGYCLHPRIPVGL